MSKDFISGDGVRLHIYRLPAQLHAGYAFGGGNPVAFLNVDFFDAAWGVPRDDLVAFIKTKRYFDPKYRFLVLATSKHPTLTFTIEPDATPDHATGKE